MPKYYRTSIERNIDSSKDENTLKLSTDDPTVKMTLNGKEIKSGTYTRKLSDGKLVSSTPTTVVKEEKTVKTDDKKAVKEEKVVKTDDKKAVKETEKDTRSFWQRHPWLRVLLTIFLCLLLIGLLMIAAYHIMHAINNSKKNDEIKNAEEADKQAKDSKDKLTTAQKEKLEKGELTSDKVKEDLKKEQVEADNAKGLKEQFDKYNNSSDTADKAKYANEYANSQKEALEKGELKSEDLQKIADKENNDVTVANDAKDASYVNLTKDNKTGLTKYQAEQLKDNKDITVLNDKKVGTATKSDVDLYNDYKTALTNMKDAKQTAAGHTNDNLINEATFKDLLEGKIKVSSSTTGTTTTYSYTDDKGKGIKDPFSSITDTTDRANANQLASEFTKVADYDNTIVKNATNLTADQRTAIHNGTFDVTKNNKFVASEEQQGLIDDYNSKVETLAQEQSEADYAKKRYEDVLAYEGAPESEKANKLDAFGDNEKKAMTDNVEALSKYYDDRFAAENEDVTQAKELLSNVESIEENQAKLQQIAKDNGVEYTDTTTLDDIKSGIINTTYDDNLLGSHGWFRKAADIAFATGAGGTLATAVTGIVGNAVTKDDSKKVVTEKKVIDDVNNKPAEKNTKTVTQTTTTVSKS